MQIPEPFLADQFKAFRLDADGDLEYCDLVNGKPSEDWEPVNFMGAEPKEIYYFNLLELALSQQAEAHLEAVS